MRRVEPFLIPAAVLLAWEAAGDAGILPIYLSAPSIILATLVADAPEIGVDLAISLYRAYAGFAIGAGLGVTVGLAAGLWRPVRRFFDPLVAFLYPVPKIVFLPVFLLLLGLGDASKVAIVAVAVFFPVFLSSQLGVRAINQVTLWSARNMGAGRFDLFVRVVMPAAAPALFDGLRIGLGHSFVLLFAAELIGSSSGLGYFISQGEESVRFDMMFAGILCFALIGFASDRLFLLVRRRVLRGSVIGTEAATQAATRT